MKKNEKSYDSGGKYTKKFVQYWDTQTQHKNIDLKNIIQLCDK